MMSTTVDGASQYG